ELLKYIVNDKKCPVIYICIDKPCSTIKKLMEKENIDPKIVVFIDVVTLMSRVEAKESNCIYISGPENLTDVCIALSETINSLSGNKPYIIIDSLSTLLVYNKSDSVVKFAHIFTAKTKQYGAKGLVISAKKSSDDQFVSQVFQFFDDSIDLGG
ncbi:MAG: hypothetical protein QW404_02150, partial [Candidatus Nanoarchaeia archaeon]